MVIHKPLPPIGEAPPIKLVNGNGWECTRIGPCGGISQVTEGLGKNNFKFYYNWDMHTFRSMVFRTCNPPFCPTLEAVGGDCHQVPPTNQLLLVSHQSMIWWCHFYWALRKCLGKRRRYHGNYISLYNYWYIPCNILFDRIRSNTVGPFEFLNLCTASIWVAPCRLASLTYTSSSPRWMSTWSMYIHIKYC